MTVHVLPCEKVPAPASLGWDAGLEATEALMRSLAAAGRLDRAGIMVQEHLATGGKRVRARLALAAADAFGLPRDRAVPWAAAVELLHNATLIHDDIQDGDTTRRGQPTTWVRHGVGQAINAGDLMLMLPFLSVSQADVSGDVRAALCRLLADAALCTVRGQVEDLDLLPGGHLGRASWERAARGKTGGLFSLPIQGAALCAGLDLDVARTVAAPFEEVGVLFQLQDDVVDLYGNKGRGAVGSDLREGKVSSLVVAHLERCPEDQDWLLGVLRADRADTADADVLLACRRFRESGALEAVVDDIRRIETGVRTDPRLPETLRPVAVELLDLVLRPIQHLL